MVHLTPDGEPRRALVVDSSFITVPIHPAAAKVITDFIAAHRAELEAALAPHDLKLSDIAVPTYERIVWQDEVKP